MRLQSEPIAAARELELLVETTRALNDGDPLDVVLEQIARAGARSTWRPDGELGSATLWKLQGLTLSTIAAFGDGELLAEQELAFNGRLQQVVETRKSALLSLADLPESVRNHYAAQKADRVAAAPVVAYGRPFGVLTVPVHKGSPDPEADLRLVSSVAELSGLAVAAAVDFDLELRLQVAFELLPRMIAGASGAEDSEEAAAVIVNRVGEVPGLDRVLLFMREDLKRGLWIKASTHPVDLLHIEADEGLIARAVHDRRIIVSNNGEPWESQQDAAVAGDAKHMLAVPVAVAEDVIGLVTIASRFRPFSATDVQIATILISALTGLLEGVRLRDEMEEEKRIFRSFYHGLACAAVTHDTRGRLVDANWAAENITGLPLKQMIKRGVFGPDWTMQGENGMDIPLPLRPPESVLKSGRPVHGMRARVTPPGGQPRWLRIDSRAIEERRRMKWVVTTFFETAAPGSSDGAAVTAARPRRGGIRQA
jgi:PAS domain-containing protein